MLLLSSGTGRNDILCGCVNKLLIVENGQQNQKNYTNQSSSLWVFSSASIERSYAFKHQIVYVSGSDCPF